jgi:hypothetical protein
MQINALLFIIDPVNPAREEKVKPVWALLLNLCYDLQRVVDVVVGGVEALLGQFWVSFFQNLPNALTTFNPFQLLEHIVLLSRFHYRPRKSCDLQGKKTKALVGALVLFLENEVILLFEFFPTSSYSACDHLLDGNVDNDATSDDQSTDDEIVGK